MSNLSYRLSLAWQAAPGAVRGVVSFRERWRFREVHFDDVGMDAEPGDLHPGMTADYDTAVPGFASWALRQVEGAPTGLVKSSPAAPCSARSGRLLCGGEASAAQKTTASPAPWGGVVVARLLMGHWLLPVVPRSWVTASHRGGALRPLPG